MAGGLKKAVDKIPWSKPELQIVLLLSHSEKVLTEVS